MNRRVAPRAALALLAAAALAGCVGGTRFPAPPSPGELPPESPLASRTLEPRDAWLRHYLLAGETEAAVELLRHPRRGPRDPLVRDLQLGLVLHQAGRWAESNGAFERAEAEAERRHARSVTQAVGSLLASDAVISYTPPAAEMAMIPYYRMLNYLSLGDAGGARVEARKATAYLERLRGRTDGAEPCVGEGLVQYLAGLAFAGAGDRADALVALRQAERAYDACSADGAVAPHALGLELHRAARAAGLGDVADSAAARYRVAPGAADAELGQLVVMVEEGWVAHRAGDALTVPLWDHEVEGLEGEDDPGIAELAARVSARVLEEGLTRAHWGASPGGEPVVQTAALLSGSYVMRLSWAEMREEPAAPAAVRLRVDGQAAGEPAPGTDLSVLLVRSWERRRAAALARLVARGITRYVVSREAEQAATKKHGEVVGWLAGLVTNVAGNSLERADTRSWSLLPHRVSVARLALPAGEHHVVLEVLDGAGAVAGTLDLGPVAVEPGRTRVLARRVWSPEATGAGPAAPPPGQPPATAGLATRPHPAR